MGRVERATSDKHASLLHRVLIKALLFYSAGAISKSHVRAEAIGHL
jgi:hypothetical protein